MIDGIEPGTLVWVDLDPAVGREQVGRRLAVIVASVGYLSAVTELVIIVPATTRRRGWPQQVELTGSTLQLPQSTYAMTEQPRTISRRRISGIAGKVEDRCLDEIRRWLADFLHG